MKPGCQFVWMSDDQSMNKWLQEALAQPNHTDLKLLKGYDLSNGRIAKVLKGGLRQYLSGISENPKTFDGSYGHVDKVLTFIQQFDAAFGGEDFTEASKLRNVAMHLTKSARHWWSTLCAKNQAPKTWKVCRLTIMKQFLDDDAEDNVLTAWHSLKFKEGESLQNYIEKFWDTCLKATVYRNINFSEKRQQFCAGLPEDMRTYVQALLPKTIAAVIHYTRVAYKIFKPKNPPNKGDKGKDKENGSSNVKSNNKKQASKRPYQGTNRLSPEEMERYRKENRCFRCGTTGHTYRECPQRNTKRETPKILHITANACMWDGVRDQGILKTKKFAGVAFIQNGDGDTTTLLIFSSLNLTQAQAGTMVNSLERPSASGVTRKDDWLEAEEEKKEPQPLDIEEKKEPKAKRDIEKLVADVQVDHEEVKETGEESTQEEQKVTNLEESSGAQCEIQVETKEAPNNNWEMQAKESQEEKEKVEGEEQNRLMKKLVLRRSQGRREF
ncbi:hypothetical protein L7F22_031323 [Adiantum nelumboides]|nr:hypothetical protein [Adiantum nelumboides]